MWGGARCAPRLASGARATTDILLNLKNLRVICFALPEAVVGQVVQSQGNQERQNSHHGQSLGHVEADNPGIYSFG
jgi:hypothetical protein